MKIVPRGPLAVTSRAWRGSREPMVTLVVRVTYELRQGRCEVASRVEPVRTSDRWVEGDRGQSYVREPSDLAPMKEAADVVIVGKAYAPREAPSTEVAARAVVGEIDKTVRVTGPRRFGQGGAALQPALFREAPIDWTRTSGGTDSWNPVGVGDREVPDLRGETIAPTMLPYGVDAPRRGAYVAPVGFGPIAPTWAPRADTAPAGAIEWVDAASGAQLSWNEATRPAFFQCAPPDQRLARPIRNDERLVLDNLHADHPRLVTNLPGAALHAVVVDAAGERRSIELGADTLWIDTERSIATVTHRAALPARVVEGREVVVWLEGFDSARAEDADEMTNSEPIGRGTVEIPPDVLAALEREEVQRMGSTPGGKAAATPFTRTPARTPARTAPAPSPPTAAAVPLGGPPPSPATVLAAPPLGAPPLGSPPLAASPLGASPMAAPPLATPPIAVLGAAPAARPSWTPSVQQTPTPVETLDTRKLHEQAAARRAPDEPLAAPAVVRSEAAAPPQPPPSATSSRPIAVEVVWFDSTTEVAAASRATTLLQQLGETDDGFLGAGEAEGGTLEVARRDVGRWFRKAAPLELNRMSEQLTAALEHDDGGRPFVVVAGELAWSFDPREMLRAWIGLGAPLAVDPRVKEAVETAERTLAQEGVAIPDVLMAAVDRLRDAVRASAKLVGTTPIDSAAERWLVEERAFAKRRVWGQLRLRAHLHAKGARAPLPVYLPDGAGFEAPLSQRFAARVLGEIRTRQDPTEPATVCLRAIALGVEFTG